MANLKDVLCYIVDKYPRKSELSNARLTKLVYLADWVCAVRSGQQLTSIQWYFDNYGPFVWDVRDEAKRSADLFQLSDTTNFFGEPKLLISRTSKEYHPDIAPNDKELLDRIIERTSPLDWGGFIKAVYATHPVASSSRYTTLDLVAKANEYKATRQE